MSASTLDRRHAREVELAMEIAAAAAHQGDVDAAADRVARARWHFVRRIHEQLRALAPVPGIGFIAQLLANLIGRLRREDELDVLEDRDRAEISAAAHELAGLLDGTEAREAIA